MASCGRIARGKTDEQGCNVARSTLILDQCFTHDFDINGAPKRLVIYYTTGDKVCLNLMECVSGGAESLGTACSSDSDCGDEGKCTAVACNVNSDCKTCSGGPTPGEPCDTDKDCSVGGTCMAQNINTCKVCDGGIDFGATCVFDRHCDGIAKCIVSASGCCQPSINAVPGVDIDADGLPDCVSNVARFGEEAWRSFVDFGFEDPNTMTESGGVKTLEVLLFELTNGSGWCCEMSDADHGGGIQLDASMCRPDLKLVMEDVVIHEMFHATQLHYPWPLADAGATTMMDHTDAAIDMWNMSSYFGKTSSFLSNTEQTLLTWTYELAI